MHAYLLNTLEMPPVIFQRLLEQMPESALDEKTDPNRFTLREALAHLADWEPIMLGRIKSAVDQPGSTVLGMDEGVRAEEMGYTSWDPHESLRKWAELRAETVRYLKGLPQDQWELHVIHNEKGRQSVYDQANQFLGHDMYHLEHATQFLKTKSVV